MAQIVEEPRETVVVRDRDHVHDDAPHRSSAVTTLLVIFAILILLLLFFRFNPFGGSGGGDGGSADVNVTAPTGTSGQ